MLVLDSIGACYVDDLDDISYRSHIFGSLRTLDAANSDIQNPDKDYHALASLGHH